MIYLIFIICLLSGFFIYRWSNKKFNYFKDRNIPYGETIFLFGGLKDLVFGKISIYDLEIEWYKKFPDKKLVGLFSFYQAFYQLRDIDLMKQLFIKDFNYFTDRSDMIDELKDPLLGNALIFMRGQKWKNMRDTLSPAFTGSKMRLMCELITECSNKFIHTLKNHIKDNGKDKVFEMQELFTNYTVDVIATCAFGIEVNSLENPNNEFAAVAEETIKPKVVQSLLTFFLITFLPKVAKTLDISFLSKKTKTFFRSAINDTMEMRERNNIYRPDMINLLMQSKKGTLNDDENNNKNSNEIPKVTPIKWSNDEIVAQCVVFFLAGFNTVSTTLSYAFYEMAIHPEIQDKIRYEILECEKELNGKPLSYDCLQKLKYLEQFINEVLRYWPPTPSIERCATKDYKCCINGQDIIIEKGKIVTIPMYALHMDDKYFPNARTFDPERFNDDNIKDNNMSAYIPFGIGPRNCIGLRFAMMELKAMLYHMVLHFSIEVCEKTDIPLKFKKSMVSMNTENGVWLRLNDKNISESTQKGL